MRLVDTHAHAWGENTDELPWTAPVLPPGWSGAFTHGALCNRMDEAGVDEAVVTTTPLYGRGPRANEYTMRSIEAHPDRLWGVGLMDFFQDDPDAVRDSLRRVVGHERMLGVRMYAALEYAETPTQANRTGDWILDDRLDPVWEEAAALETAVFIFPRPDQLSMVERIADAYPDLTLVVDHMAYPDDTDAPGECPWADFEALADHGNVAVKLSSLPRMSTREWPYPDLHDYVRNLLEWFGAERLMLGSDFPWVNTWATYDDCLSWVEDVDFLSTREYAHLSHRTFDRLLR